MSMSAGFAQKQLNTLSDALFDLQHKQYSGIAKLCAEVTETQAKRECYLLFNRGRIALAERTISSPDVWVAGILRRLKVKCINQLMDYVAKRIDIKNNSPYQVLEAVVATRVTTWEAVEKVITERIVVILEEFLPYPCALTLLPIDSGMTQAYDHQGIDCAGILQKIEQRQNQWKEYLVSVHSVHAIPHNEAGALAGITHEPTKQHLQKWVDGRRSLADIAEALDKDPLVVAQLYCRWVKEGLVVFRFGLCEPQKLKVVLSVDDSPIVQALIRRSLCEQYEVLSASSAMEALGILSRRPVDLILLDVTMPDIDGFEFCHTIRKMSKFKDTPVIMLTAKDGLIDRARGHMAGTNRYLTKPVEKEELLKVIKEYIP
jgi:CheY-like chemotaxis protein